jgi:predicted GTPase
MKHKCPHTRQIPEVAIIVKTQRQDVKIYSSNIKVLSQGTCIWNTKALSLTIQKSMTMANVQVFGKLVIQSQGHKVKKYGTIRKFLP